MYREGYRGERRESTKGKINSLIDKSEAFLGEEEEIVDDEKLRDWRGYGRLEEVEVSES